MGAIVQPTVQTVKERMRSEKQYVGFIVGWLMKNMNLLYISYSYE